MERTVCFGRANAVCRGERCKIRFLRPFVGTDDKESKLSTAICRGGRLCPPSKSVDFSWIFVGADAHIGPPKCCDFALDFRKNGHFPRADRVVRPYGAKSKPCTITPFRPPQGCFRFGGGMGRCGHRPLRRKTGECYVFPRPFVGADAHIGPLKCCGFASDFHKTGQFRWADRVVRPYGAKSQFHGFAGKPP